MRRSVGTTQHRLMSRFVTVCDGAVSYAAFLASFLYAIGFVGNFAVPHSIDHGVSAPVGQALVVNVVLLALFAVQHGVMARPAFKRCWTRFVPNPVERSTYVLLASTVLFVVFWQWRTIPAVIWDVSSALGRVALWSLFWLGWATAVAATFMIDHFELFGLRQVLAAWRRKPATDTGFRTSLLYRLVRHPLMLGFIIAFWAAPTMTGGHLLFAIGTTAYILIAIRLEERDLMAALGTQYRQYRSDVPVLIPQPRRCASRRAMAR
jgi:protein-S-isoprenylcysteine O-methyltransferase Ste14